MAAGLCIKLSMKHLILAFIFSGSLSAMYAPTEAECTGTVADYTIIANTYIDCIINIKNVLASVKDKETAEASIEKIRYQYSKLRSLVSCIYTNPAAPDVIKYFKEYLEEHLSVPNVELEIEINRIKKNQYFGNTVLQRLLEDGFMYTSE